MGADYYIDTFAVIKFIDAAKGFQKVLLNRTPSWADDLHDQQELRRLIIYKNNGWTNNIRYDIINYHRINLIEVDTIEELVVVCERF